MGVLFVSSTNSTGDVNVDDGPKLSVTWMLKPLQLPPQWPRGCNGLYTAAVEVEKQ